MSGEHRKLTRGKYNEPFQSFVKSWLRNLTTPPLGVRLVVLSSFIVFSSRYQGSARRLTLRHWDCYGMHDGKNLLLVIPKTSPQWSKYPLHCSKGGKMRIVFSLSLSRSLSLWLIIISPLGQSENFISFCPPSHRAVNYHNIGLTSRQASNKNINQYFK